MKGYTAAMTLPALVIHDRGCRWARLGAEAHIDPDGKVTGVKNPGAGHSDAAKRFCDTYNLHKVAGSRGWIAIRYQDGSGGMVVYDTRYQAIADCWPNEDWYFYCSLQAPSMTVCAAESVLRYKRVMSEMERPDRDAAHGGLEVIPRLAVEDQEAQIRAVRTGRGYVALGHRREKA